VANGGTAYRPSLVYQIQEADGTIIQRTAKIRGIAERHGLREDQIELIRRGMWRVVNDPGGTGARAQIPGITVAEKRETAQFGETATKDNHTWFVAFAPYETRARDGGARCEVAKAGGQVPAPIARR